MNSLLRVKINLLSGRYYLVELIGISILLLFVVLDTPMARSTHRRAHARKGPPITSDYRDATMAVLRLRHPKSRLRLTI